MADFNAIAAARRLAELEAQMAEQGAPGVPGLAGTPGGPVQESPTMKQERLLQLLAGLGAQGLGLATVSAGAAEPGLGLPGQLAGAVMGAVGNRASGNAIEPDIRDVWADQLRMKLQGR